MRVGCRVPWWVAWGMIASSPVCVACASDAFTSNESAPWASRPLDTLSMAEQEQLCRELHAEIDDTTTSDLYRQVDCTLQGWNGTSDIAVTTRVAQCQSLYDQCLTTNDKLLSDQVECTAIAPLDVACTTVGALRDCYRAWGPNIQESYDAVLEGRPSNCVEAFEANGVDFTPGDFMVTLPNECGDIRRACGL